MADQEIDEGQEAAAGGQRAGPGSVLSDVASRAKYIATRTAVVHYLLPFATLVLILLIIVFGGVWAAAIKGFFGERLHQDSPLDDATRRSVVRSITDNPEEVNRPCPEGNLVVPNAIDREFLEKGYTFTESAIGATAGTTIQPDQGMIESMKFICDKHQRLHISHIISAYVNMRLDPEQQKSRDPQIIKNISAHNKGQAYDLVEIDFVYKVFRFPCPPTPNFTVEYWNDQNQLLLAFPCKERPNNVNTTFQGAPAQAIPIKIAWQDQGSTFALGGLPVDLQSALRGMAGQLGLPADALLSALGNPEQMLSQMGRSYLESLVGLDPGALAGGDLPSILVHAFSVRFSHVLDVPIVFDWGGNLKEVVKNLGGSVFEQAIRLFPGSLAGWSSPEQAFQSVGLETAAQLLRLPTFEIKGDLAQFQRLSSLLDLSEADRERLAAEPIYGSQLLAVVDSARAGDLGGLEGTMQKFGQTVLEASLLLPEGTLTTRPGDRERGGQGIPIPDPVPSLLDAIAKRTGLERGTVQTFINAFRLGYGGERPPVSLEQLFQDQGTPLLEQRLGLPEGTVGQWLVGKKAAVEPGAVLDLAHRLGLDPAAIESLLTAWQEGSDLAALYQDLGSEILGSKLRLNPDDLLQIALDRATPQLKRQVEGILSALGSDLFLTIDLGQLFTGQMTDYIQVLEQIGAIQLGDTFGLGGSEIQQLLAGDFGALLGHPAVIDWLSGSFGWSPSQLGDLLSGLPTISHLAGLGGLFGGVFGSLGLDASLVMETVYKPEARRKVHQALGELLEMPFALDNIDLRVTQLITGSHERDVAPFEADGTLDKVYGQGRSRNFGLFAMPEALDHLHIAY